MARYKDYDYSQGKFIPIHFDRQILPGTFEYSLHYLIDKEIDLSIFDLRYRNDEMGAPAYDPAILLKIILYAYSRGITSSRKIAQCCQENVIFMALSADTQPPFTTIAEFISTSGQEIIHLFLEILLICDEMGLIGKEMFAIDGCKLPSNASKEWSGTKKELEKKRGKMEKVIRQIVKRHRGVDEREADRGVMEQEEQYVETLRGKVKKIKAWLRENGDKPGKSGKPIKSNITDNESAKLTSSHGVLKGYNANAIVDEKHQIVVHAAVFGKGEDGTNMEPMLQGAKENLEAIGWEEPLKGRQISADTGYYSVKNLEVCREHEVDAYVPDPQFRKRDVRFGDAGRHRRSVDKRKERYKSKKRWFSVGDFKLDDRTGKLICPAGHGLYVKNRNFVTSDGHKAIAYQAPKTACRDCRLRSKCLRHPDTESRQVHMFYGERPGSITDEMKRKIETEEGRRTYSKRLGIVEPVFGNIRACKKMDRFTLRGWIKVNIQWMLYCLVHNIEKIINFGKSYAMAAAS